MKILHLHLLDITGEKDFLKPYGMELLESYVDPVVIHHPKGHTIPRFGKPLDIFINSLNFIFSCVARTL